MTNPMTRCDEIGELLSAFVDGELSPSERSLVDSHLPQCRTCRETLADFKTMVTRLHALPHPMPTAGYIRQLHARIRDSERPSRVLSGWLTWKPTFHAIGLAGATLVFVFVLQDMPASRRGGVMSDDGRPIQMAAKADGAVGAAADAQSSRQRLDANTGAPAVAQAVAAARPTAPFEKKTLADTDLPAAAAAPAPSPASASEALAKVPAALPAAAAPAVPYAPTDALKERATDAVKIDDREEASRRAATGGAQPLENLSASSESNDLGDLRSAPAGGALLRSASHRAALGRDEKAGAPPALQEERKSEPAAPQSMTVARIEPSPASELQSDKAKAAAGAPDAGLAEPAGSGGAAGVPGAGEAPAASPAAGPPSLTPEAWRAALGDLITPATSITAGRAALEASHAALPAQEFSAAVLDTRVFLTDVFKAVRLGLPFEIQRVLIIGTDLEVHLTFNGRAGEALWAWAQLKDILGRSRALLHFGSRAGPAPTSPLVRIQITLQGPDGTSR